MKCITLFFQAIAGKLIGRLANGIAVRDIKKGEDSQQAVQLGHYGAGQWCAKVGFLKKEPPTVKNGKVFEASIVALPNTKKRAPEDPSTFCVLAAVKADDNDTRILVRVNTEGTYKTGSIGNYPKDADELPHGWGKHTGPDGGGESFWYDGLVAMSPGDLIPVQPEGGAPEDVIGLFYDPKKGLGIISVAEYQRLAALATTKAAAASPTVPATPVAPAPPAEASVSGPAPEAKSVKKPKVKKAKSAAAAEAQPAE